jgi:hypothetical protein
LDLDSLLLGNPPIGNNGRFSKNTAVKVGADEFAPTHENAPLNIKQPPKQTL